MKRFSILLFSLLLLSLNLSAQRMAKWELLYDGGMPYNYQQITYVNNFKLYNENIFGFMDKAKLRFPKKMIITQNGGSTWDTSAFNIDGYNKFNIYDWNITEDRMIYILADSVKQLGYDGLNPIFEYKPQILKSSDLGKNWNKIDLSPNWRTTWSKLLLMSDSLRGFAVIYPCKNIPSDKTDLILRTENGWLTWDTIPCHSEIIASQLINYYNGKLSIITIQNKLYTSTNFGKTWEKVDIESNIFQSDFVDNHKMVADGFDLFENLIFYRYVILDASKKTIGSKLIKSEDGGLSWELIDGTSGASSEHILDLNLINDTTYVKIMIGFAGSFLSKDRGTSWEKIEKFYYDNFSNVIENLHIIRPDYWIASARKYVVAYKGDSILSAPRIIEPKTYFKLQHSFQLKWTSIKGASKYELEIVERAGRPIDEENFPVNFNELDESELFLKTTITSDTSFVVLGNNYKAYSCRVRAVNDEEASPWVLEEYVTDNISSVPLDKQESKFAVSPNPAETFVEIQSKTDEIANSYEIYDVAGNVIQRLSVLTSNRIDLTGLSSGVYFIKINESYYKVIKK